MGCSRSVTVTGNQKFWFQLVLCQYPRQGSNLQPSAPEALINPALDRLKQGASITSATEQQLGNACCKTVSHANCKTTAKRSAVDGVSNGDVELALVIEAWTALPPPVKAGIVAMVKASVEGADR